VGGSIMAGETVKLPVIGPTKKTWVYVGGALVAGFIGYAWWNRNASAPPIPVEEASEAIAQDREPPVTQVGTTEYDPGNAQAVINTNAEWVAAAVSGLSDAGWEPLFVLSALGKHLARRTVNVDERELIQAAYGLLGPPPQGGPYPILDAPAGTPSVPAPSQGKPGQLVGWHGIRIGKDVPTGTNLLGLATRYANYPNLGDSVESTKRGILARNPFLVARGITKNSSVIPKGWIVLVPTPSVRKVA
jgi:hypothetical protein